MAARTSYAAGALAVPALVALTLVALALATTGLLVALGGRAAEETSPARRPEPAPATLLADWDARRGEAWATGDLRALQGLYVARSRAGARDVAMLRRYLARGLRVEGLQSQRLAVTVLARTPGSWVLRVRDRLAGGVVVGRGARVPLPRDEVSVYRVTLSLVGDSWRVAEVSEVGFPAARLRTGQPRSPS